MSIIITKLKTKPNKNLSLATSKDATTPRQVTDAAQSLNPCQDKVDIVNSLIGILPADITEKEAREERLSTI